MALGPLMLIKWARKAMIDIAIPILPKPTLSAMGMPTFVTFIGIDVKQWETMSWRPMSWCQRWCSGTMLGLLWGSWKRVGLLHTTKPALIMSEWTWGINIVCPSNTVITASSGAVSSFPTLVCWTCRRFQRMWVIVLTEQWRGLLRCPMLSTDSWPGWFQEYQAQRWHTIRHPANCWVGQLWWSHLHWCCSP